MKVAVRLLGGLAVAAVISACSYAPPGFETDGLIAPPRVCTAKPSSFGVAEKIADISEGNGCAVSNAWLVHSIANVQFSERATLDCIMASPLNDWLANVVQPASQSAFGESVASVDIAASYSCRPRNNVRGAKMSEHGFGNAIDIAAFNLASGRKVTVLDGWNGGAAERIFLRNIRAAACNDFMTVLGPGSDSEHRNHFHLDLQNRRSGKHYCH